ncbi:MAG: cyclic nucleotide-binding domain-containing protein [Actinomycetota bacterium]
MRTTAPSQSPERTRTVGTMSGDDDGRFPLLRRTQLSRFLTDEQLRELEGECKTVSRRPWATLFRQGEEADSLFLVVEGSMEL